MRRLQQFGVTAFNIPPVVDYPKTLQFRLDLEPGQLWLSAPEVVQDRGRSAVDAYARTWGELKLNVKMTQDGRPYYLFMGPEGVVARSRAFNPRTDKDRALKRLHHLLGLGAEVRVIGRTVIHCERDDEWYERARYTGEALYHYVVLPTLYLAVPVHWPASASASWSQ